MAAGERDLRLGLLNSLLMTPHRRLDELYPVHQNILRTDPRFYVQLAAWYATEGEVRDHKEMFIISLVRSAFPGHRDVGLALLRELPPYEVARVVDFIKGGTRTVKPPRQERGRRRRAPAATGAAGPTIERYGLNANVPGSVRTEVERYLRERESDNERLDRTVMVARKSMKRLYAGLHIKPSPRAQAILFDDVPPKDSRLHALKAIAKAATPAEQAQAIVEHGVPFRIATSVIRQLTPSVLVALVDRMTPQEVINSLGLLKRRGAFDNPEVKALIEGKLALAKGDHRVSAYKAKEAAQAVKVDADLAQKLDEVTESRVVAKGTINRPTALLIDKSGSMQEAIEIGKRLGSMIAGICKSDLFVYAFDTMPYPIEGVGTDIASWERALSGINAGGGTACGVAVEMMRRRGQRVDQVVMVTDEEENQRPGLVEALYAYGWEMKTGPSVLFVKTRGASSQLEQACLQAMIPAEAYQFSGDYYSLPNLVPLLTRPSRLELLMDIMAVPLPKRRPK